MLFRVGKFWRGVHVCATIQFQRKIYIAPRRNLVVCFARPFVALPAPFYAKRYYSAGMRRRRRMRYPQTSRATPVCIPANPGGKSFGPAFDKESRRVKPLQDTHGESLVFSPPPNDPQKKTQFQVWRPQQRADLLFHYYFLRFSSVLKFFPSILLEKGQ